MPQSATTAQTASIGSRFAARALDTALKAVVGGVALVIIAFSLYQWLAEWSWTDPAPMPGSTVVGSLVAGAVLLTIPVYEVAMVAVTGQTLGKRAARIRVVRLDSDQPPGWGRAIGRWFLPVATFWSALIASSLILMAVEDSSPATADGIAPRLLAQLLPAALWLLVRLSAIWNRDHRGWHDRLAGTRVVEA